MTLDLRTPLGFLFTLYGLLLMLYGWLHRARPGAISAAPVNLRADLVWGAVLLVLGVGLLWLRMRAGRRRG